MSPEIKVRALAATREAAIAFVEDMAHIRELLANDKRLPRDLRHLSGILRRLLIDNDGDLRAIAPPRIGKLNFRAPDNSFFYRVVNARKLIFYASGGPSMFGLEFRSLAMTEPEIDKRIVPDQTLCCHLKQDGFLGQKVIALNNEWATRRDVIKYVANVASGVHSGKHEDKGDRLLQRARKAIKFTPYEGGVKLDFNQHALSFPSMPVSANLTPDAFDVVLIELRAAAHFIAESEDIKRLEALIRIETSI